VYHICRFVILFLAFVLNNAVNAMKLFSVQLPVYALLVAISFVTGYLLIPRFGINGAGLVFLLGNVCLCVMMVSIIYVKLRAKIKETNYLSKQVTVC
jgi:O-antigen/teichoic acid export membrane protein